MPEVTRERAQVAEMPLATITPLVAGAERPSADMEELTGVDGRPLARVQTVPSLLAQMVIRKVRQQADGADVPRETFAEAAGLFVGADLGGESPKLYLERTALATGLPLAVVRGAMDFMAEAMRDITRLNERDFPRTSTVNGGRIMWFPAGKTFAMVAVAGKHPGPNGLWLRALSLGYSVLVRPGRADPFTPRRLALALLAAGLPVGKISVLPGDDSVGQLLMREADRSVIFGPEERIAPWRNNYAVQVHGVGRSKIVLDHDPTAEELDFVAASVADEAGVRCDCASVVLTTEDPAALAERLAELLAGRPTLTVTDPAAVLPAVPSQSAAPLRERLAELAKGMTDHSTRRYGGDPLERLPDGSYAVRPVVLSTDDGSHPTVGTELVAPFAVVAPWRPGEGIGPLTDTLVLTLLGERAAAVVELAAAQPSIHQVITCPMLPWATSPAMPEPPLTHLLAEPTRIFTAEREP